MAPEDRDVFPEQANVFATCPICGARVGIARKAFVESGVQSRCAHGHELFVSLTRDGSVVSSSYDRWGRATDIRENGGTR